MPRLNPFPRQPSGLGQRTAHLRERAPCAPQPAPPRAVFVVRWTTPNPSSRRPESHNHSKNARTTPPRGAPTHVRTTWERLEGVRDQHRRLPRRGPADDPHDVQDGDEGCPGRADVHVRLGRARLGVAALPWSGGWCRPAARREVLERVYSLRRPLGDDGAAPRRDAYPQTPTNSPPQFHPRRSMRWSIRASAFAVGLKRDLTLRTHFDNAFRISSR